MVGKKKGFRYQGKNVLGTYPHCDLTPEEALAAMQIALARWEPVKWVVARERHKDEDFHIHIYVRCRRKISTTDARFMDLLRAAVDEDGEEKVAPQVFHGRYESCRNADAVQQYCKKDGDYISNEPSNMAAGLLDMAADKGVEEAMLHLRREAPALLLREGKRIRSNLAIVAPPPEAVVRKDFVFIADQPPVVYWKANAFHKKLTSSKRIPV